VILSDHISEIARAPFAGEDLVGHVSGKG
jgi:hypothetical protein